MLPAAAGPDLEPAPNEPASCRCRLGAYAGRSPDVQMLRGLSSNQRSICGRIRQPGYFGWDFDLIVILPDSMSEATVFSSLCRLLSTLEAKSWKSARPTPLFDSVPTKSVVA